ELTSKGVKVITGQSVTAFREKGQVVELSNGQTLSSDVTILSVGVAPDSQLAKNAGIKLGLRGGILVDQNYQTNQDNIYAVGDAIVVKQEITGQDA
ncbi:FAD/NAD(P)-binding oxidoreductase, partial [Streptococcus suis]